MRETNVLKSVTIWGRNLIYQRCIMTRPFIACDKFNLDFVLKVTRIIESFDIWNFWNWHKHDSRCIFWRTTLHTSTRSVWPLSRSQQQYTFLIEINGMRLKIHIIIMWLQLSSPKLDIQTPVVMFYFLLKYQVSVTSFLAFVDHISIFLDM